MEILVAYAAMAAQEDREENKDEKEKDKKRWAKWKRGGLIGAAAVTGGALLALTGGRYFLLYCLILLLGQASEV